jgi:hypothetical protein
MEAVMDPTVGASVVCELDAASGAAATGVALDVMTGAMPDAAAGVLTVDAVLAVIGPSVAVGDDGPRSLTGGATTSRNRCHAAPSAWRSTTSGAIAVGGFA